MIEGLFAVFLNLMAIAVITFVISNLAVSAIVCFLAQKFLTMEVKSRKAILWLLALIPWLAVICVGLCFVYQMSSFNAMAAVNRYTHWHHMNYFEVFSWHSVSLIAAAFLLSYVSFNKVAQLLNHRRQLRLLQSLSTSIQPDVFEINAEQASAFTGGFLKKRCYVTSGMLKETTEQEQAVILGHEKAHALHNDPLKKWLFSIAAAFYVPAISARLKLHMTLAMEQEADRAVINEETPATFVASTLVKVARLNQASITKPLVNNDLVSNFGADVLEQRVYFLLDQLNLKPVNKITTTLFVLLTLCLSFLSIDGVHHFMETVFNH